MYSLSQYYTLAASPPVGDTAAMVTSVPMQQMQQKLPTDRLEVSSGSRVMVSGQGG